jgi:MFS superfamily sulfate permease-like transporter
MFKHLNKDFPSGLVVFLVALPLCLGIALASGAPPMSGIIAGIVGGIVISALSGSELSVSGPAAGLAVIVADSISHFTPEGADMKVGLVIFTVAVVIAGALQFIMGVFKWGMVADFIPNSVIKGCWLRSGS